MTRSLLIAALPGAVLLAPRPATAVEGRYTGSYNRIEGGELGSENLMRHRYDLGTRSVTPGGFDLRLRTTLEYQSRPGESDTEILRSRYFAQVSNPVMRLESQFTPWQDTRPGDDSPRQRSLQLDYSLTPQTLPRLRLRYDRVDRDLDGAISSSDDRRAELSYAVGDLGSHLSFRRLDTEPDSRRGAERHTREWRGGLQFNRVLGTLLTQASYDALYSTFETRDRDQTYYTQRADLTSNWRPFRFLTVGGAAYTRWGRIEDNVPDGDRDIDERSYSGRVQVRPLEGVDLQAAREYQSRSNRDDEMISDYLRFQASLRRELFRRMTFQTGYLRSVDLESENGAIPSNTGYALVDGRLRRGISARAEVRISRSVGEISTGTQWRRLVQLRTRPSPEMRVEVAYRMDDLPEISGQAQRDREWELITGWNPSRDFAFTGSLRSLHGEGRIDREERFGSVVGSVRMGERTSVTVNWSRRETLAGASRTSSIVSGTDLSFRMPGEVRTKLTWRRVSGRNRPTLDTYGLIVDKTF